MRLPSWDELVNEQRDLLDVLNHPLHESLFVVGPPGSGKTVLAVRRAAMVAESDRAVVLVTYNRMLRRLLQQLEERLNVSTMHSFVGADLRQRARRGPPFRGGDMYAFDWNEILKILRKSRAAFSGVDHMVVDEAQDLPAGFFTYASRHVSKALTVFADEHQALSASHASLEQIKSAAGLENPVILKMNHRNCPEVARLATYFHGGRLPAATVRRGAAGELPRLVRSNGLTSTAKRIANWITNRGGTVGVIVSSNSTGSRLRQRLVDRLEATRVDFYEHTKRNEDSIDILKPGVTVLNKESVKGQEFDAVFVLELENFLPCPGEVDRRTMYMLCSRARDHLFLVHGPGELSQEALKALPGPDVLART